jgi:prepilin-type N-terminal cleavage/methylation domain-containing protein
MIFKRPKSAVSNQSGFTLVELMMVVGILGVLASIALMAFTKNREKGFDAQVISIMKTILTTAAIDEPKAQDLSDEDGDGNTTEYTDPEAAVDVTEQGTNLAFLGPDFAAITIPNNVYWNIHNDGNAGEDKWQFWFAHPAGRFGYYFWIPGGASGVDDDGDLNVSDRIVWDDADGSYRNIASLTALD